MFQCFFMSGIQLQEHDCQQKYYLGKSNIKIMSDLQQTLMGGKGRRQAQQIKKRFEQCEQKIKTLKNKNNELQKQCDNELQGDIRSAIRSQTSFIETEIKDMRKTLELLARDFTDPGSKKKIKDLCALASREMERNKRIMGEFVNRASNSNSYYKRESSVNAYRRSRTELERDVPPVKDKKLSPVYEGDSSIIASEEQLSDIKAQQKMMAERTALIKQLEEKNNKINDIINQMGGMIGGQQKDMINQIQQNVQITYNNVGVANQNLQDAAVYQKKSKKKLICLVTIIIILILAVAGTVYFFVTK